MKVISLSFFALTIPLIFLASSCGTSGELAESVAMPEWVLNYHKEFPDSKYIAQKATGKTADESRNEAAASLSFYFETTVNANRESNYRSFETTNEKGKYSARNEQETVRETKVTTNKILQAVESTEPWYNKKDKTWHCVAFVVRETVWKNFEPTVRVAKDDFLAYYNMAEKSGEPFEKIRYLGMARKKGEKFLDAISYAQFLSEPLTSEHFQGDILLLSELNSIQQEAKNAAPVFVSVSNDGSNKVYAAFAKGFTDSGFTVVKEKGESVYTADITVILDKIVQDELIILTPSVRLSLVGKNGSVYSYAKDGKRVKAYTDSLAERKALESICPVIDETFTEDFNAALSGK